MDISETQSNKQISHSQPEARDLLLILNCGRKRAGGDGLCAAMTRPKKHVSFRCEIYLIIAGIAQIRSALGRRTRWKLGVFSPTWVGKKETWTNGPKSIRITLVREPGQKNWSRLRESFLGESRPSKMFLWAFGLGLHGPLPSNMLHRSLGRPIRDPQDTRFLSSSLQKRNGSPRQKEICSFAIVDLRSVSDEHKFSLGEGRGSRLSK
ncbi:hypothetical protein CI102_7362 [Trichoderma harzianum]|nr:hypothetical protein CI102_7362 [Trichoderma harzianum]